MLSNAHPPCKPRLRLSLLYKLLVLFAASNHVMTCWQTHIQNGNVQPFPAAFYVTQAHSTTVVARNTTQASLMRFVCLCLIPGGSKLARMARSGKNTSSGMVPYPKKATTFKDIRNASSMACFDDYFLPQSERTRRGMEKFGWSDV